jgi:phospholipase/carboxylesterase
MPNSQDFFYLSTRTELRAAPLVLLHGSGQDEYELLDLGNRVGIDRPCLVMRGPIIWESGYAFFRRHSDRSLDYDDLRIQTEQFADFLEQAVETGVLRQSPILLGFSNGAILAASVLMHRPDAIAGAILLRPLTPAPEASFPDLHRQRILLIAGAADERRAPEDAPLLQRQLQKAGAWLTAKTLPTGHTVAQEEPEVIRSWLAENFAAS